MTPVGSASRRLRKCDSTHHGLFGAGRGGRCGADLTLAGANFKDTGQEHAAADRRCAGDPATARTFDSVCSAHVYRARRWAGHRKRIVKNRVNTHKHPLLTGTIRSASDQSMATLVAMPWMCRNSLNPGSADVRAIHCAHCNRKVRREKN